MSFRFVLGPSGAGKSTYLVNEMTELAKASPDTEFLYIVPDQYTMQMQKQMVLSSPGKCIMNIDVLSLGRLSHRLLENVEDDRRVLDDTGKNLLVARLGRMHASELPVIGKKLQRQSYVHEVKSAISEFMQYGIGDEQLGGMISYAKANHREALAGKLTDLGKMYRWFLEEAGSRFVTTESRLALLAESIKDSKLLKGSVVVFDGFTGFTPIQLRVIEEIMKVAGTVTFAITADGEAAKVLGEHFREEDLFALGHRTARAIRKIAARIGAKELPKVVIDPDRLPRYADREDLRHLEKNIFRGGIPQKYKGASDSIFITSCMNMPQEVRWLSGEIRELTLRGGYQYRDIAVICGNLDEYKESLRREFDRVGIPGFIDATQYLIRNACVEFARSALRAELCDYSYESVFRFLRSGISIPGLTDEEIDKLENIVLEKGIDHKYKWQKPELGIPDNADAELTEHCRTILMSVLGGIENKTKTIGEHVMALYGLIEAVGLEEQLLEMADCAEENGDYSFAAEYRQIYRAIMQLLEQMYDLSADEPCTLKEFTEIFEAGIGELRIATLPLSVDRVLVGDIERTRLSQVKVMFFIGVNDGNIPKDTNKGGILSDLDRQLLAEAGPATGMDIELAPTPRELMYRQRLYLYINLTKPQERLYISYVNMEETGKAKQPSYLVKLLTDMFEGKKAERCIISGDRFFDFSDGIDILARELSNLARGITPENEKDKSLAAALYELGKKNPDTNYICAQLSKAAFVRYAGSAIGKELARAIYGSTLRGSITQFQTFAECRYKYFLQYGLKLSARAISEISTLTLGNMFHAELEYFETELIERGLDWSALSEEEIGELLERAFDRMCSGSNAYVLNCTTARNRYAGERVRRLIDQSARTMAYHLAHGSFSLYKVEEKFSSVFSLEDGSGEYEGSAIEMTGKIDRVDLCKNADDVFVKIMDYKSSSKVFDMDRLCEGTALQLPLYMDRMLDRLGESARPAAMLYYAISDPMVEVKTDMTPEEMDTLRMDKLKMQGIVNSDERVLGLLDDTSSCSDKGKRSADSMKLDTKSLITEEDFRVLTEYAKNKSIETGREILSGDITCSPVTFGDQDACKYCDYEGICGFCKEIPGYERRVAKKGRGIKDLSDDKEQQVWE